MKTKNKYLIVIVALLLLISIAVLNNRMKNSLTSDISGANSIQPASSNPNPSSVNSENQQNTVNSENSQSNQIQTCPTCNGKGSITSKYPSNTNCPKCMGNGCQSCEGTGKVIIGKTEKCPQCGGDGLINN